MDDERISAAGRAIISQEVKRAFDAEQAQRDALELQLYRNVRDVVRKRIAEPLKTIQEALRYYSQHRGNHAR